MTDLIILWEHNRWRVCACLGFVAACFFVLWITLETVPAPCRTDSECEGVAE